MIKIPEFLPTTLEELNDLGWKQLDVILVSGDAYVDSPFSGISIIGKVLVAEGYTVGVISQPDITCSTDIMRLGSPKLFWGVTAGMTDSLVANYTASGKKRQSCDFTPGGVNNKRPDRAVIAYTNLIKQHDKTKAKVVLGGIEASLRRFAHYDLLSEKIRRPVLFDAKADFLIYGMGEKSVVKLAEVLSNKDALANSYENICGLCYPASQIPDNAIVLPSYEDTSGNSDVFHSFFTEFYNHASSNSQQKLVQKCGSRHIIQNPQCSFTQNDLDKIYGLGYARTAHPYEKAKGEIRGEETIRFSITTHRGCFGECNFCAITAHQGRSVVSRSINSILSEVDDITKMKQFKGYIQDVGGPTANMFGSECARMQEGKPCSNRRCLYPDVCPSMNSSQKKYVTLLREIGKNQKVKKAFIASGIRCDLVIADKDNGEQFIKELALNHTSGQIKLAPEHTEKTVLDLMGKSNVRQFMEFSEKFKKYSINAGKKQFITCYFMVAHPGCDMKAMQGLKNFISKNLDFMPEQVQIFTPTPSTWSTCMYHSGKDTSGRKIYITKSLRDKNAQKDMIIVKKGRK